MLPVSGIRPYSTSLFKQTPFFKGLHNTLLFGTQIVHNISLFSGHFYPKTVPFVVPLAVYWKGSNTNLCGMGRQNIK